MKVAMLLLAAGRGSRFGGTIPKTYLPLGGRAVLVRSAERLQQVAARSDAEHELVIVVSAQDRDEHLSPIQADLERLGATIVDGGNSRQESMRLGLAAASADCELVLVHDAARPLLPIDATLECIRRAGQTGAALLATPATDTLKRVNQEGLVQTTIDRGDVHSAQTPQVIRRTLLDRAFEHAATAGVEATDDVGLIEAMGNPVAVVQGSSSNIKITRTDDLALAEFLWSQEQTH